MTYYYLKIGPGNILAQYWLSEDNVISGPAACIYFGPESIADIKSGKHVDENIMAFYELCTDGKRSKVRFLTIYNGELILSKPIGEAFDLSDEEMHQYDDDMAKIGLKRGDISYYAFRKDGDHENVIKVAKVSLVYKAPLSEVPNVIATISCNQRYTRNTLTEIKDKGNIIALDILLNKESDTPIVDASDLLELLGPYQLETLLFLTLLNHGLHVPAWRGGTLKEIDLVATNRQEKAIELSPIVFETNNPVTFQIKRRRVLPKSKIDWNVGIGLSGENVLGAEWLLKHALSTKITKEWLINSLDWVPDIHKVLSSCRI